MLVYNINNLIGDSMNAGNLLFNKCLNEIVIMKVVTDVEALIAKNNLGFSKIIGTLKSFREDWQSKLEEIDKEELLDLLENITEKCPDDENEQFSKIISNKEEKKWVVYHAISVLHNYLIKGHIFVAEEVDGLTKEEQKVLDKGIKVLHNSYDFEYKMSRLFAKVFFGYLEDAVNNTKDEDIRKKMIIIKDHLLLIFDCIFDDFINNPLEYYVITDEDKLAMKNLTDDDFENQYQFIQMTISSQVEAIELMSDEDLEDKDKELIAYIRSLYIKAIYSVNFFDGIDEVIDNAKEKLKDKTEKSVKYLHIALEKDPTIRITKKVD